MRGTDPIAVRLTRNSIAPNAAELWRAENAADAQHIVPDHPGAVDQISSPLPRRGNRLSSPMTALRILIIEDEAMVGMLLAELLISMGYDVCGIEATEADAVAAAARWEPDLMIVDVWLDDGNGVSAIAEILRAGPMPHFFVSGDTAGVRALKPDAVVMQKPFRELDLARAIDLALGTTPLN